MPWTPAQHRLFEAAAHSPEVAASYGLTVAKAAGMAAEGVKKGPTLKAKALAAGLRGKK